MIISIPLVGYDNLGIEKLGRAKTMTKLNYA